MKKNIAIQRVRQRARVRLRRGIFPPIEAQLNALTKLSCLLCSTTDLEMILDVMLDELRKLIGAESGGVLLFDPEKEALVLQKPAFGLRHGEFKAYSLSVRQTGEYGIGAAVRVFLTGRPYICNEPENDPLTNKRINQFYGVKNSLTVPLIADNVRIGALHLINKSGGFTPSDSKVLSLVANHFAAVIQNARLFNQVKTVNEILKYSAEIHRRLSEMLLAGATLEEMAGSLRSMVLHDVVIFDPLMRKVASTVSEPEGSGMPWVDLADDPGFKDIVRSLLKNRKPVRCGPFPEAGVKREFIIAPLMAGRQLIGYLCILQNSGKLSELEMMAAEHAVTVFTLKMVQERAELDIEERIKGDLLDDLLTKNYDSGEGVIERAARLGLDLEEPCQVCVLDIADFGVLAGSQVKVPQSELRRQLAREVQRILKDNHLPSLVGIRSGQIVVLARVLVGAMSSEEQWNFLVRRIIESVPRLECYAGVGKICRNLDDIRTSYREAKKALVIAKRFRIKGQPSFFSGAGLYRLLLSVENEAEIMSFAYDVLGKLIEYDAERKLKLMDTLKAYVDCNCDKKLVCERLFVHANTLKYRLQRIEDIGGFDLARPDDLLKVSLALKALELFSPD